MDLGQQDLEWTIQEVELERVTVTSTAAETETEASLKELLTHPHG